MSTIIEAMRTIGAIEQRIRDGIQATAAERDTILGLMDTEANQFTTNVLDLFKQYQTRMGELRADLKASYDAQIRANEEAIGAPAADTNGTAGQSITMTVPPEIAAAFKKAAE